MRSKVIALSAALIACLCLGGAVVAFVLLFQVPAGAPSLLRAYTLQWQAQSQPCPVAEILVPGTYHADPVQTVGDWVVVVYTAECAAPGQTHRSISGYASEDGSGNGCGGSTDRQPVSPSAAGQVTISVESLDQCGGAGGTGGLSLVSGSVTGAGAVTAQAVFASGPSARAPVQVGRFVIVAANGAAVCSVRALDATGTVLAENRTNWPGPKMTAGACP
jgi:adhesin HecA-like repeat protein